MHKHKDSTRRKYVIVSREELLAIYEGKMNYDIKIRRLIAKGILIPTEGCEDCERIVCICKHP
jgi:hypothetical protein